MVFFVNFDSIIESEYECSIWFEHLIQHLQAFFVEENFDLNLIHFITISIGFNPKSCQQHFKSNHNDRRPYSVRYHRLHCNLHPYRASKSRTFFVANNKDQLHHWSVVLDVYVDIDSSKQKDILRYNNSLDNVSVQWSNPNRILQNQQSMDSDSNEPRKIYHHNSIRLFFYVLNLLQAYRHVSR